MSLYYEFTMNHRLPNNSFHLVPGVQVCKFESVLSDYRPSFNHFRVAVRDPDIRNSAKRVNSQSMSQQGKLLWFLFCIIPIVQCTSIQNEQSWSSNIHWKMQCAFGVGNLLYYLDIYLRISY